MSRETLRARLAAAHPVSIEHCPDCRELAALLAVADAAAEMQAFTGHVWVEDSNRPEYARLGQALASALADLEALP